MRTSDHGFSLRELSSQSNPSVYIRAARCFLVEPALHADPKPCGGSHPKLTAVKDGRDIGTPVKSFGVWFYCVRFRYLADFDTSERIMVAHSDALDCIDGSWMYF
ncbi:hypothetical protein PRIPAC_89544 [Pristionchus pacificus]|uniref:Uncharacterized protein n=1 Tax=Pristionchus pacificus TaxID=54126 RepID=A0A2A6B5Q5_PRIPA|nr:hypothetical protein PRIPAC_89544 [Pristionchus pacificus]|eukprot:PDM61214.1 hypothetical protein PRIPAC_50656 [Pristionchus pacificus]